MNVAACKSSVGRWRKEDPKNLTVLVSKRGSGETEQTPHLLLCPPYVNTWSHTPKKPDFSYTHAKAAHNSADLKSMTIHLPLPPSGFSWVVSWFYSGFHLPICSESDSSFVPERKFGLV